MRALTPRLRRIAAYSLAVGWISGLAAQVYGGTWWLVAVAPLIERDRATRFTFDPISSLPIRDGSWVVAPWIPALALHHLEQVGGVVLLSIASGVLMGLVAWLAYRCARTATRHPLPIAATVSLSMVMQAPLQLQAQSFALPCCAAALLALRRRSWWWCPPIMVVWANVHGSAPIGLLLCVLGAFGLVGHGGNTQTRRWPVRERMAWLGANAIATLINPLGYHYYTYVRDVMSVGSLKQLSGGSWSGLSPTSAQGVLVAIIVVAVAVSAIERRDVARLAPVGCFTLLSLLAARNTAWLAIVIVPVLATAVTDFLTGASWSTDRLPRPASIGAVAIVASAVVAMVPGGPVQSALAWRGNPSSGAMNAVGRGERALAYIGVADVLYVRREATVFVDARMERFRGSDLRLYEDSMLRGDDAALERAVGCRRRNPVDALVVSRIDQPGLARRLVRRPRAGGHGVRLGGPEVTPRFRDRRWIVARVDCRGR